MTTTPKTKTQKTPDSVVAQVRRTKVKTVGALQLRFRRDGPAMRDCGRVSPIMRSLTDQPWPNHALQRTAPGVTACAPTRRPAPAAFPHRLRRPPQSLSLGSFGKKKSVMLPGGNWTQPSREVPSETLFLQIDPNRRRAISSVSLNLNPLRRVPLRAWYEDIALGRVFCAIDA